MHLKHINNEDESDDVNVLLSVDVNDNDVSLLIGLQLLQFCEDNCYTLSDSVYMPDTSFTFDSDAHDTVSWLDHAVSSFSMHEIIFETDVLHNYLTSDHFPCLCVYKLELRMMMRSSLSSIK